MSSAFKRVAERIWSLGCDVDESRRRRLLFGETFEQIVCLISESAILANYSRERHCCKRDFYRIVVTLQMEAASVDLFHNSASGYRGQYYCGVGIGEEANRYAVRILLPRILELIAATPKRTCPIPWAKKSIQSDQAKLWIHQGRWLRSARWADRNLQVRRWVKALDSEDVPARKKASAKKKKASARKKAMWGSLAPYEETKIVLKGAFINLDGTKVGKNAKPKRSEDICNFGFT